MKAAVLFKPNEPLQVVECELDPPKAQEVRVKMRASGVCQSDWHVMNGDWPSPMPIVPGHAIAPIRAAFEAVLGRQPDWDGRSGALQVAEVKIDQIELKLVMSAADPTALLRTIALLSGEAFSQAIP